MMRVKTYVKHMGFAYQEERDIGSRLDALIQDEMKTGASLKLLTSAREEGYTLFTLVFERNV